MGWITDLVVAAFVAIIGLYVAYKLGITLGDLEMYFHHFIGTLVLGRYK